MLIHILTFDKKFLNAIIELWDKAFPKSNAYYIIGNVEEYNEYTNEKIKEKAQFIISSNTEKLIELKNNVYNHKIGFVHYATKYALDIVSATSEFPWVWCMWGGDYAFYKNIYTIDTLKVLSNKSILYLYFYVLIRKFKFYTLYKYHNLFLKWSLFRYVAPVITEEYEELKENFPKIFKAKIFDYSEGVCKFNFNIKQNGSNILIGNSAFPYNNHITAFKLVYKKINTQKVIVPLSYGGSSNYIQNVKKIGNRYFGDNFAPLEKFINLNDYIRLLSTCSHAIIASKRQLAMGNILILLSIGIKIFLYEENPVFKHIYSQGFIIYSINELRKQNWIEKLSEEEKLNNFQLLQKYYMEDASIKKIKNIVDYILNNEKIQL